MAGHAQVIVSSDGLGANELAFTVVGILIGVLMCAGATRWLWRRHRQHVTYDRFEQERRRIAQQLHDTVGHNLVVLALQARRLGSTNPHLRTESSELDETVRTTLDDLRQAVGTLRGAPENVALVYEEPLSAQVRGIVSRLSNSGQLVELCTSGTEPDLPAETRGAIVRVVREGLTNAVKHGAGRAIDVRLCFGPYPCVEVLTHGVPGLAPGVVGIDTGLGLKGLRELVEGQGGSFESGQLPDGSFRICARFGPPWPAVSAAEAGVQSAS